MKDVIDIIGKAKLIPVVKLNDVLDTVRVLSALRDGGLNVAEITFRTDCASEAIAKAKECFADMLIGAGTVVNVEQAKKAVLAGAEFIVSPGFCDEVSAYCAGIDIPYIGGCVTPTEIMHARSLGIRLSSFFLRKSMAELKRYVHLERFSPILNSFLQEA